MRLVIIIAVFVNISVQGFSATIHVPTDYKTIQQAIDAAVNGDTVLVAPGTYKENIDFKGKAISVESDVGPDVTIIDGNKAGNVVTFQNNEGLDSLLKGFTITNGFGIDCFGGSPTIAKNIVTSCLIYGIACNQSASPAITENMIAGNWQGINCSTFSSPVIMSNLIMGNDSVPGPDQGGTKGGGIFSGDNCSPMIVNNIICGNRVYGGTTFTGKWIPGSGGGICCTDSATLINNTIFGNSAELKDGDGGGISGVMSTTIANSILWNNGADIGAQISGSPTVTYCDVQGGWPGAGNIDSDPLFVDSVGLDFHLTFPSPCRDSGDNSVSGLPKEDFEGDPRIANGITDMGADEFHIHLYYTGNPTPGGSVKLKVVDVPGTSPVILWVGSGVLDPPFHSKKYGDWYLQFPLLAEISLGSIPFPTGILVLTATLDPGFPTWDIPLQALSGDALTNLCVLSVK